ncbi:FMN-binding negative transcriptional regulator [Bradyrhizobium canariense]|uniref:FMN-binding negative transcriptional regulator n=1 Tax=Bradyrhizobium canariense TaxID=255045 RepID=UPI000A18EEDA|nr:FMN-binding negative transcriptional regulator [Bradyrhizobium canariense]OSI31975.1 transcriptional regulator [Bradyrhizobium canariense]OSI35572.1 transcriptional regulator [Bradyrhizobium canariense]OSI47818.1 transcriptional regulator [Bradyrhizobium canariense]OSI55244.1 transcriptional regulator [Bradyrhizobium canariense]OSI58314.1 transcriptional regulator [Bradyrhizobium canariense]
MYTPSCFQLLDIADLQRTMREARTATLVTATHEGLVGTMLPVVLDESAGSMGTIYAHVARANPQWKLTPTGEAIAIFGGAEAYISPSWYVTKHERGEAVPTWNYVAVHAYGPVEFFEDSDRLREVVTRLTDVHERSSKDRWAVSDAPADFIKAELEGIIGLRLQITRLDGTRKMSQNRNAADRAGVIEGLSKSDREEDRRAAHLIPKG